jgi:hypothetical protein
MLVMPGSPLRRPNQFETGTPWSSFPDPGSAKDWLWLGPVPNHVLRPLVKKYYGYGYGDKKILRQITRDIQLEENQWTLSYVQVIQYALDYQLTSCRTKTIQRRRREWDMPSVKQQAHTLQSIAPMVERIRAHSANWLGAKSLWDHLRDDSILVSRFVQPYPQLRALLRPGRRKLLQEYQAQVDVVGNCQRRMRRLKRSALWTAGLHEVWTVDQHDKWLRFGLFLHVGMESLSNSVLWLRVWWTNKNPRLIARYYLEVAAKLQGA